MEKEFNQNVKSWYIKEYPTDTLGEEINEEITFKDISEALNNHKNIYDILWVGDSLVRTRVFKKLANVMKVDYNYIYEQYLLCN